MPASRFDRSAKHVHHLELDKLPRGRITATWLHIINNGLGEPIRVPIVVARGANPGPVLGLTAAIHGNELNGIRVIQTLFEELDPNELNGDVVGVLAVNVPGVLLLRREFNNGVDLNHIAPGKPGGSESDVFMHRFLERIVKRFDYLIDLHTASSGRVNSYYIRADMRDEMTARIARLQNPEIILNNPPADSTLRGAAASFGVKAVTLELQDPGVFQKQVIGGALAGVRNVLHDLGFLKGTISCPAKNTILCQTSAWMYTDEGGILVVEPQVTEQVKKGQLVAEVKTIFGETVKRYTAPNDAIVIGRSVNPINQTGSRIVHLGYDLQEIPCLI